VFGTSNVIRKKLFKKTLVRERTVKSKKLYSIGDIVECRIPSSKRRGSVHTIGVVVDKKAPKNSLFGSTYCVVTPKGIYETPYVKIVKNL